jgi:ferredoxin--NADP+ reductase
MVWDPEREEPLWDTFVVGWARKASDGLVGKAKQDSEQGCEEVLAFLDGEFPERPDGSRTADAIIDELAELLGGRDIAPVDFEDVQRLESVEEDIAEERGQKEFKFASNERMLEVIEESA